MKNKESKQKFFKKIQSLLDGKVDEEKCLTISNNISEFDYPGCSDLDRYSKLDLIEAIIYFRQDSFKNLNRLNNLKRELLHFSLKIFKDEN